jgi:hypothetical protein
MPKARVYFRRYPAIPEVGDDITPITILKIKAIPSDMKLPRFRYGRDINGRQKMFANILDAFHVDYYRPNVAIISTKEFKGAKLVKVTWVGGASQWSQYMVYNSHGDIILGNTYGPCGPFMRYLMGKNLHEGDTLWVRIERTKV